MWPGQVSSPRPLALESDLLLTALHGPAAFKHLRKLEVCLKPAFEVAEYMNEHTSRAQGKFHCCNNVKLEIYVHFVLTYF